MRDSRWESNLLNIRVKKLTLFLLLFRANYGKYWTPVLTLPKSICLRQKGVSFQGISLTVIELLFRVLDLLPKASVTTSRILFQERPVSPTGTSKSNVMPAVVLAPRLAATTGPSRLSAGRPLALAACSTSATCTADLRTASARAASLPLSSAPPSEYAESRVGCPSLTEGQD